MKQRAGRIALSAAEVFTATPSGTPTKVIPIRDETGLTVIGWVQLHPGIA